MRATSLTAATVGAAVVASAVLAATPIGAAVTYYYFGYAGGSQIRAANSAITSQLSAESTVLTPDPGVKHTNALASVQAQGVLVLGAVHTSAQTSAIPGGQQISVRAKAANVNVLNGLITADAITTTTTVKRVNGAYTVTSHTAFSNLHILGVTLPVNIPHNYGVRLGDIASVALNAKVSGVSQDTAVGIGAGLQVTLLKPEGSADTGAQIDVTPTFAEVAPDSSPTTGHTTTGLAYATKITGAAGSNISVRSDPTVPTTVYAPGTNGQTLVNSLATLNLAPVGTFGAVRTTGVATNTTTAATVTLTASAANVNLLNGLITATAVKVTAHADLTGTTASMNLSTLKIGGTTIPLNVAPNTVINLKAAKVTVNQQIRSGHSIIVRAIDVVLLKPTASLPTGAEIQIASASAAAS
jgi:hypothetical protein